MLTPLASEVTLSEPLPTFALIIFIPSESKKVILEFGVKELVETERLLMSFETLLRLKVASLV